MKPYQVGARNVRAAAEKKKAEAEKNLQVRQRLRRTCRCGRGGEELAGAAEMGRRPRLQMGRTRAAVAAAAASDGRRRCSG